MSASSDIECQQRVEVNVPTFDGHLNQSNTDWRRWFDAIHTAQEIDSGLQARSGSSGRIEREAQGTVGSGAGRACRSAANVAARVREGGGDRYRQARSLCG